MYSASHRFCGEPSFSVQVDDVPNSASGCFRISFGKPSHDGCLTSPNNNNNNNSAAVDDDDPTVLIAKAMSHLTLQEREQAYEDVHGVSAMVHETYELINEALNQLELCLQKTHHKPAYDMAVTI
jgi:hypothetical protein